jgi:hypothetical protein
MRTILIIMTICISLIAGKVFAQEAEQIQIAILLDTSSSMDGLISQAKANLWKIVNETAKAKKGGKTPKLEVALFEYGNDGLSSETGFIRLVVPLTGDLDRVSEELFKLTTNGGSEYCGMVIDRAVKTLKWTSKNDILKVIYIAGNEPFSQGSVDYKDSEKKALSRGIVINTIYCGGYQAGISEGWKDGAERGDGSYISIDQDQKIADIHAPQDDEILALNQKLNTTYIAFGSAGKSKKERQAQQDANSAGMANEAAVQRAMAKSAPAYSNSEWDLVDASKDDKKAVDKLKEDELPAEMKKLSPAERSVYVEKKRKEREEIQLKIKKLSAEREKYIEKEMKKGSEENTLDSAIIQSIKVQAKKKGYTVE